MTDSQQCMMTANGVSKNRKYYPDQTKVSNKISERKGTVVKVKDESFNTRPKMSSQTHFHKKANSSIASSGLNSSGNTNKS